MWESSGFGRVQGLFLEALRTPIQENASGGEEFCDTGVAKPISRSRRHPFNWLRTKAASGSCGMVTARYDISSRKLNREAFLLLRLIVVPLNQPGSSAPGAV